MRNQALATILLLLTGCIQSEKASEPQIVTVLGASGPITGQTVLFHDESGKLVEELTTDDEGLARPSRNADMISVPSLTGDFEMLDTRADLRGRSVTIGQQLPEGVEVVATLPDAVPGAMGYMMETGCGSAFVEDAATPVILTIDSRCTSDGTFSLLALAIDSQQNPLEYAVALEVDPNAGSVSLTDWAKDWAELTMEISGAPAEATMGVGQVAVRRAGVQYTGGSATTPIGSGSGTVTIRYPAGLADGLIVVSYARLGLGNDGIGTVEALATVPEHVVADVGKAAALAVADSGFVASDDATRPDLSWSFANPEVRPNFGQATAYGAFDQQPFRLWQMTFDGTRPGMRIPEISDALAGFRPKPSIPWGYLVVQLTDLSWAQNYTDVLDTEAAPGEYSATFVSVVLPTRASAVPLELEELARVSVPDLRRVGSTR